MRPATGIVVSVVATVTLGAAEPVLPPPTSSPGNYNRLLVGHSAIVEEGAVVARGGSPDAIWYNPAGLARETEATLSGNASVFEYSRLETSGSGASSEQSGLNMFPAFVGTSFPLTDPAAPRPWVLGLALVTSENWSQTVSFYQERPEAGGLRTVGFESNTEIQTLVPTAAIGWGFGDELDLGAQLALGYTTYDELRTRSVLLLDSGGAPQESTSVSSRFAIEAWVLRAGFGARWRPSPRWRFGAIAFSPSLQLAGSGDVNFSLFADNPSATATGRLREDDPEVEVRTPFSLAVGAAYLAERWEVEFDLTWFADPGDYEVVGLDQPLRLDFTPKGGGSTITVTETLDASQSSNRATAIVALGGRYRLNEVYQLHAGLSYNASPTDASSDDSSARDLDLWSIGLGASRTGANVSSVLALRYSFGDDDSIAVEDLVTGDEATVKLDVAILTLGFSTAYRF